MDRDQILDRLIAFWLGGLPANDEAYSICRTLTGKLTLSVPSSLFEILQTEPHRHRQAIEQFIRPHLDSSEGFRDLVGLPPAQVTPAPAPTYAAPSYSDPYPAPVPVARPAYERFERPAPLDPQRGRGGGDVQITGNGNVGFSTGDVTGPLSVGSPPRRQPGSQERPAPRHPQSPIRILFLGANPMDSMRLRLDEEVREIDRALNSATLGSRFELHQKWAVRASEIQSHLLRIRPQILHFSGHGSPQSAIILQGEDGNSRPVAGPVIARVLGQFSHHLQCVVLNACYSEEQAQAISMHIDCIVGMNTAVADRAAIRFAAVFYEALASGSSVRAAFEMGCSDIDVVEMGQQVVPRLISARRSAESIVFAQAIAEP